MINNELPLGKKNIVDLTYSEDAKGNDIICYPNNTCYTGIVFETSPDGAIVEEYEVKDGLKDGAEKGYYAEKALEHITHYRQGYLHGNVTYYYPNGAQKEKSIFEYGIRREISTWDEDGKLTSHSTLATTDENYKLIERFRAKYGW